MEPQITDVTKLPPVDKHVQFGLEMVTCAEQLPVETAEEFDIASTLRDKIKSREKEIVDFLQPFIDAANKAHKSQTSHRKKIIDPLNEAVGMINRKILTYERKQEKLRIEEQKRADEEAKLEAAAQAKENGNDDLAKAIMDDQVPVAAAPVEAESNAKVSFVKKWTYVIEDESQIPRNYLMPDERAIKATVTSQKGRAKIPGVRIYEDMGVKSKPKGMSKRAF